MPKFQAKPGQADLVETWKTALADGTASARCDELVRKSPIPNGLADALWRAPEIRITKRGRLIVIQNRVTAATTLVEEGRPPWIAATLRLDGELKEVTIRMDPATAFALGDALARHALRLDEGLVGTIRERVARERMADLTAGISNGEPR